MRRREALAATALGILLPGCGGGGSGGGFASIGSGGTGISPGGIGSGGTGVVVTSTSVGPIEGFGSIIVNGIRFEIGAAQLQLQDISELRLGVIVQVLGTFDPATNQGTATAVRTSADLRGLVGRLDVAAGQFTIKGIVVEADTSTVFAGGLAGIGDLGNGQPVQVHGLPGAEGQLRATRVELLPVVGAPVVSGVVQDLDPRARTFLLGSQVVAFGGATLEGTSLAGGPANGQLVRVRAEATSPVLIATSIEPWSEPALANEGPLSLGGLVTEFRSLASLRVNGQAVDASGARVAGGPAASIGNGVRVDVSGAVRAGVLVAESVRLRDADADAGAETGTDTALGALFSASGSVGAFRSPAQFKVQGQDVDASGATLVVGGTLSSLGPGVKVLVTGARVVDDVLLADRVEFL